MKKVATTKELEHTTVRLTLKDIPNFACHSGYAFAKSLLPVTISTNPEDNWALACEIADHSEPGYSGERKNGVSYVAWLHAHLTEEAREEYASPYSSDLGFEFMEGPLIIQQDLAAIADVLAKAKGK